MHLGTIIKDPEVLGVIIAEALLRTFFLYTSPCLDIGTCACNCYSPNNALLHTLSPDAKNNTFGHMSGSKTHQI